MATVDRASRAEAADSRAEPRASESVLLVVFDNDVQPWRFLSQAPEPRLKTDFATREGGRVRHAEILRSKSISYTLCFTKRAGRAQIWGSSASSPRNRSAKTLFTRKPDEGGFCEHASSLKWVYRGKKGWVSPAARPRRAEACEADRARRCASVQRFICPHLTGPTDCPY